VGAGLSGLTAAYRLQQAGWDVTVFERSNVPGGRVQTLAHQGFLFDVGAIALADSYAPYLEFLRELGLQNEVVPTSPWVGIYREGQIHELNMQQLARSGMTTKALSPAAKIRMLRLAWDVALAKLRGHLNYADMRSAAPLDTETAMQYAHRALSPEIDQYFGSPIVRTMLIADTDVVSKVEFFSGVANILNSRILALRGGQGRLPRLLAEKVQPLYEHEVVRVERHGDTVEIAFATPQGDQQTQIFDACVLACPLPQTMQICAEERPRLEPLSEVLRYTQCITVAFALRQAPKCRSFLVQMPAVEDPEIALLFLDHNMSPDRAPAGCGLVDCHWESSAAAKMMERTDEEIVARSMQTVLKLFPETRDQVLFTHVTRWRQALPLTNVGVYQRIGDFNANLDPTSNIQFASDYMSAAGQHTAVELGTRAAQRLIAHRGQ
jgi:oxygen-dependent protoporphyrinogen oxidase